MKKILLLLAGLAIISCKTDSKEEVDYVLFSGKIENPLGKKIVVSGKDFKKDILLKEDGSFADTLKVESGYYTYLNGGERANFYLTQGDELNLTLNAKEFDETIAYTGKGAAKNNYLAKKFLANENVDFRSLYKEEETEFLKKITETKTKAEETLKNTKDIDKDFVALETKNLHFEYLDKVANYPNAHPYLTKKEDYKPSESIVTPLKDFDYDNEENFSNFDSYKNIVMGHFMGKIMDPKKDSEEGIQLIKSLKSQSIKDELSGQMAYYISPSNEDAESLYTALMEISTDDAFKKELTKKFDKIQNLIAGKDSPVFDYENHKGGKTSLADLQGKYVYIDVWATWCGPCIAEIPSLKNVEKKYHDKNIEFVSISIDTKNAYKKWKKMVVDKELGGTQLIADNAWQSKFVTDYAIEGIPRFILIGPDGKIVNADAPRPSNPELIKLFDELKI